MRSPGVIYLTPGGTRACHSGRQYAASRRRSDHVRGQGWYQQLPLREAGRTNRDRNRPRTSQARSALRHALFRRLGKVCGIEKARSPESIYLMMPRALLSLQIFCDAAFPVLLGIVHVMMVGRAGMDSFRQ